MYSHEAGVCRACIHYEPPGSGGAMMRPDPEPLDGASAAALVARVVCELDRRDEREDDVLLSALLCAAWPSSRCQHQ
jgi:hypothetical protein